MYEKKFLHRHYMRIFLYSETDNILNEISIIRGRTILLKNLKN